MACNECEQYRHQLRALRVEATQAQAILGVIRRAVKEEQASPAPLKLDELERRALLRALEVSKGHRGRAANVLGVARSTLFEMLKRHGLNGGDSCHA